MKKHLALRFNAPTEALLENMESIAAEMEAWGYEGVVERLQKTREISELDYMIGKIDAIQAELWRRSQQQKVE